MQKISSDLARVFRAESGRLLAALMLHTRSIDVAEDALQEAFLQASEKWPQSGTPRNKAAWLLTVARRRLIDHIRKDTLRNAESTIQTIEDLLPQNDDIQEQDYPIPDERLRLIFTCCHPALASNVRVPLTLKTLCGLSVREIARAFLSSEASMQQRLTRAKRKIRDAGIAYAVPENDALDERLESVLSVIYLIYNESYTAFEGQSLTRDDLAKEAIHLARVLYELLPKPEVAGLLSLLLLHDSRRSARSSGTQAFIPLEYQDRSQWNQTQIQEGTSIVLTAMSDAKPGIYQLQAAISALHAISPDWASTDWPQIYQLYGILYQLNPSPVVALNQCVAQAYYGELDAAYVRLSKLEDALKSYQPFYAAKAELALRLGEKETAIDNFSLAISLTKNTAEKDFLLEKKNQISFI